MCRQNATIKLHGSFYNAVIKLCESMDNAKNADEMNISALAFEMLCEYRKEKLIADLRQRDGAI